MLLRVRKSQPSSHFSVDPRKKQVTLIDPSVAAGSAAPEGRRLGVAAPKMFAFDGVYDFDDPQVSDRGGMVELFSHRSHV